MCIMIRIVSKKFAKTLDIKREFDVTNSAHPVTMTTIRHWTRISVTWSELMCKSAQPSDSSYRAIALASSFDVIRGLPRAVSTTMFWTCFFGKLRYAASVPPAVQVFNELCDDINPSLINLLFSGLVRHFDLKWPRSPKTLLTLA